MGQFIGGERGTPKTKYRGYHPSLTLGLGLGSLVSQVTIYPTGVALAALLLGRATTYVKTLHGAGVAFFVAGVALVWYTADLTLEQRGLFQGAAPCELRVPGPYFGCGGYVILTAIS